MLEKILISYLHKGKGALSEYTFKNLKTKLLEAFHKAFNNFLETFWDSIREEVKEQVIATCDFVQNHLKHPDIQSKKNEIVKYVMEKIKFPLILKPFKGVIENGIKQEVENLVDNAIEQIKNSVKNSI